MRGRSNRTAKNREKFLNALARGASVATAADAAGFARRSAYDWRSEDADFARQWDEAVESGTDRLEDVALRRAVEGSDLLLIFLLRHRRAHVFHTPARAPVRFALPMVNSAADIPVALAAIAHRISEGSLPAAEGAAIAAVLETTRRSIETAQLAERIALLEQHNEH